MLENKLIQMTSEEMSSFGIASGGYKYLKDDIDIGMLLLDLSKEKNVFYIKVLEKYQSNGYGTDLFKRAIDLLNNKKETIVLDIEDSNIKMNRIIKHYKSRVIRHVDGVTTYEVYIKK